MSNQDLIEQAIAKAGGVRPLARELPSWDAASIVKARNDSKLSPFRAAQLANYLGEDEAAAMFFALLDTAKSDDESRFWSSFPPRLFEARDREVANIAGHLLEKLAEEWAKRSEPPPPDVQALQFTQTLSRLLERERARSEKPNTARRLKRAGNG